MKTLKLIALLSMITMLGGQTAEAWTKDGRITRSRMTEPASETQDHTQYDCRETVGRTVVRPAGRNGIQTRVERECPHAEQMVAGECETHWFKGMRCLE